VINRTQLLVLGFLAFAWVALVVILRIQPEIFARRMNLAQADAVAAEVALLGGVSVLVSIISVGVVRRWRWVFWLMLVVFLSGALRILATVLELSGVVPTADPPWYAAFQGLLGGVQLVLGLLMVADYRRAGVWGYSTARTANKWSVEDGE
jgi:hypothetical protein